MSWLRSLQSKGKGKAKASGSAPPYPLPGTDAPPAWQAAPEEMHADGLRSEAPEADWHAGEAFCAAHPPDPPRLLPSADVERIRAHGCGAWRLAAPDPARFRGRLANGGAPGKHGVVAVESAADCPETVLLSDLPLLAGLYDTRGQPGVYFEVKVLRMDDEAVVAVGTACRPYPPFRLPGWNRLSAGLHLDDVRKFFEDPSGGQTYAPGSALARAGRAAAGDTVGVGFAWATGALFFTHNGARLPDAYLGAYAPRAAHDVYAAVGVAGPGVCALEVNFGAREFEWKEGNDWKVQAHVGMMPGGGGVEDELPSYSAARRDRRVDA
ncbi:uncharacterized protein BXZ73DRAFT_55804 [Epithele typhae]|uniref:uncharacterized protein n=1 Tax=Epithele typhae TaxID=378194 RepID=UPI002007E4A7|nr:uncharacterized protein BXZ73DRAFT_55804 [Epithele typhae]KAH9912852.1 hypothetical protein BXZ73DRAFT_55804 [Epithele typhae]